MAFGSLGGLVVSLGLDAVEYVQGLTKAEYEAKRFSARMESSLGGAGVALTRLAAAAAAAGLASLYMGAKFIGAAANLDDMAEKTGASVEELSRLVQQAFISGVSLETVEMGLVKLAAALNESDEGAKKAQRALTALGLSASGLREQDTAVALRKVAVELSKYADSGAKAALIRDLLGRGGAALLPILKDLALDEATLTTVTTREAAEAERLEKQWRGLLNTARNLGQRMVIDLVPAVEGIIKAIQEAYKESGIFMAGLVALGGVLANVFGLTEAQKSAKRIEEIGKQLESARKQLQSGSLNPSGAFNSLFNFLVPDIKLGEEQLEQLRTTIDRLELERARLVTPAPIIPPILPKIDYEELPDEKAAAALRSLLDQRAKLESEVLRDSAQHRMAILDEMHRDNLVGEKDYWLNRAAIQKEALDAELKTIAQQIARQREGVAEAEKTKGKTSPEYFSAVKDLEDTLAKRNKLEREFGQTTELSYIQAKRAAEEYGRAVQDVSIQVQSLMGNEVEASRMRLEAQNKELRAKMTANKDTAGLAELNRLEQLSEYQVQFNQLRTQEGEIVARLAIEEERIQNARRVGAVDELEALYRTSDARRKAAEQLEGIVEQQETLSRLWKNPAIILQADQARASLDRLRSEVELLAQKFQTIFTDSFANAFVDFVSGAQSAADAFRSFARSVLLEIAHIAAARVGASIFGGIGSAIASVFSAGSSGGAGGAGTGGEYSLGSGQSSLGIKQYAYGTDYVPKTGLAFLHQGERVMPPGSSDWSSRAVGEVNFSFSFAGGEPTDPQKFLSAVIPVMKTVARDEILYQLRPGGALSE